MKVTIENTGAHPTRGLSLTHDNNFKKLKLLACEKNQPAGCIEQWQSTLKNSLLLTFENIPIIDEAHLRRLIQDCENKTFEIEFGMMEKKAMHPQHSVPQLYFDQLNQIGKHLFQMRYDPAWEADELDNPAIRKATPKGGIVPRGKRRSVKLTRRKLKNSRDWDKWKQSEYLQLDQYEQQQMFGSCRS